MTKKLEIKCPQCKKEFNYYSSEFRPFCSERCQMIDMGHWFNEEYALPSKTPLNDEDIEKIINNEEGEESEE